MKILLIGYGKMGKAIEGVALKRGHEIVGKIDLNNANELKIYSKSNVDVAIEFTSPATAFENVKYGIEHNIPMVVGSTGWLAKKPEIEQLVAQLNGTFCYSSNYSVGVNIFWAANENLAKLMNLQPDYDVTMEEIHHVYKKDSPSGTAITQAEGILKHIDRKEIWTIGAENLSPNQIFIDHKRVHNTPGTHTVVYTSSVDSIQLTHTAFNRDGFATGAILAAEYIQSKKGVFSMKDVLKLDY